MKNKILFAVSVALCSCGTQSPNPTPITQPPADNTTAGTNTNSNGTTTGSHPGTTTAVAKTKTGSVALVFSGNGACPEGCAQAGVDVATAAGLTVRRVTGNELDSNSSPSDIDAFFKDVRVWIMPGGVSTDEVKSMTPTLQSALSQFVSDGGGYVGWCAGAFSATQIIGTSGNKGLGLFPGDTELFTNHSATNSYGASMENLQWQGASHYFYLEGGPMIKNLGPSAERIATYSDGSIAAARAPYGNGRVYISGVHPEAPTWWWEGTSISDPDGSDVDFAVQMVKWAGQL